MLACCLLKVEFKAAVVAVPLDDTENNENNDTLNDSEILSNNSFNSIAESGQSAASGSMSFKKIQQIRASLFDRNWDNFDETKAIEMIGHVL